ncbi:MAG: methyl-accepting chemotaxis protein [Gammaproteobacteria bacterium]
MQPKFKRVLSLGIAAKIQLAIAVNVVLAIVLGQYLVHGWLDLQGGVGLVVNLGLNLSICLLYGFVVARTLVQPLRRASQVMRNIAEAEGDLTQRLQVESADETGQLASNFNLFLDKLQAYIGEVAVASRQLATASEQLSASTQRTLDSSQTQLNDVATVASAMVQMNASIETAGQNAAAANSSAEEANGQAQASALKAVEAMCGIDNLVKEIEQAADDIDKLQEHSEGIGSVIEVITKIAEQTNLLALNAAIEAARAGEQGRGFAVVADEVRTLANRTQDSTQEIQAMIEMLQGKTNDAVRVMQAAREHAQQEAQQVETTAEALAEIAHSVDLISGMNQQISAATSAQNGVISGVTDSLGNINRISAATSAEAQDTRQISEGLATLAGTLEALMGQFKLSARN